jgi:hypothetical protein
MRTFARKQSPRRQGLSPGLRASSPAAPARVAVQWPAGRFAHGFTRTALTRQAKLTIDTPGDEHEREADRIAESVMRQAEPQVQRTCACGGTCDECRARNQEVGPLRRRAENADASGHAAPPIVHRALRSSGRPLEAADRAFFSPRFGQDFSRVGVHTDATAAASARAVGAFAYTVGRDVVFAAGQYAPGTASGRRLIAHELAHVVQQGGKGEALQRRNTKKQPTAGDAPKLELSEHSDPCACVVQIHNNETKAHRIAEMMHQHCKYSLTLLNSGTKERRIKLPGHKGTVDPNELFPGDVAAACLDDSKPCEDFVNDPAKAAATDEAGVEAYVQRQFFLTLKKCSKGFSLPIISLHTNVVSDTEAYRKGTKRIAGFDQTGLTDIDTKDPQDPIAKLRKWIAGFGGDVEKKVLDTKGMTNIFRWCDPNEGISKCHIGDPAHPDNIVWVTNPEDLKKLSTAKVNAVLQTEVPQPKPGKPSEAQTDLSTSFVFMNQAIREGFQKLRQRILQDAEVDKKEVEALADELKKVDQQDLLKRLDIMSKEVKVMGEWLDKLKELMDKMGVARARLDALRFVNVEGPANADVVKNFDSLIVVLQSLGLDCCGETGAAEVRAGLKPAKKK